MNSIQRYKRPSTLSRFDLEMVAEEVLNGLLCHYEPPEPRPKSPKGILLAPFKFRQRNTTRSVRWNDRERRKDGTSCMFICDQNDEEYSEHSKYTEFPCDSNLSRDVEEKTVLNQKGLLSQQKLLIRRVRSPPVNVQIHEARLQDFDDDLEDDENIDDETSKSVQNWTTRLGAQIEEDADSPIDSSDVTSDEDRDNTDHPKEQIRGRGRQLKRDRPQRRRRFLSEKKRLSLSPSRLGVLSFGSSKKNGGKRSPSPFRPTLRNSSLADNDDGTSRSVVTTRLNTQPIKSQPRKSLLNRLRVRKNKSHSSSEEESHGIIPDVQQSQQHPGHAIVYHQQHEMHPQLSRYQANQPDINNHNVNSHHRKNDNSKPYSTPSNNVLRGQETIATPRSMAFARKTKPPLRESRYFNQSGHNQQHVHPQDRTGYAHNVSNQQPYAYHRHTQPQLKQQHHHQQ